jgi:hypothetical protein
VVLRCPECFERSFVPVDSLQHRNECPRCGRPNELVAPTWGDAEEPVWYYSLHGAVRKLMNQNGDIPILGAAYLHRTARHYIDESELEWRRVGASRPEHEIDLIAVVDDEVVVAEAKRNPRRTDRKNALDKLVDVAAQLRADKIALFSGPDAPWNQAQVAHLRGLIQHRPWIDGRRPRLVGIFGLTQDHGGLTRELA